MIGHIPRWAETLDLQDVWNDGWTEQTVQQLGLIVADRVMKLKAYDPEDWCGIVETVENFKNILPVADWETGEYGDMTPISDFDNQMAALYDWCDDNRIWVNK